MTQNWYDSLLGFLVPVLLSTITWIVGAICALFTLRKHRGVSTLTLLGCCLLILSSFGGNLITWWMVELRNSGTWNTPQLNLTLSMFQFLRSGISTVGFVCLLIAIFGWRSGNASLPDRAALSRFDDVSDSVSENVQKLSRE